VTSSPTRHTGLSCADGASGGAWTLIAGLNERFGELGYGIIAAFIACWIGSVLFHRWRRPAAAR